MCSCNRFCLNQLNINYTYSYLFDDCNCSKDHKVFAIVCKICLYNFSGIARNYFSYICCSCVHLNKNMVCCHCKRLRNALNSDTIKLRLKKEDLPSEFKLVEINKCLEKYLKADPIFYF